MLILAFSQEFFWEGGKTYCYANFYCYANISIVFRPNFGGEAKVPEGVAPTPLWKKARIMRAKIHLQPAFSHYQPEQNKSQLNGCK